jgi:hypothetical protein
MSKSKDHALPKDKLLLFHAQELQRLNNLSEDQRAAMAELTHSATFGDVIATPLAKPVVADGSPCHIVFNISDNKGQVELEASPARGLALYMLDFLGFDVSKVKPRNP